MSEVRIRLKNGLREIELEGDRLLVEELLARYAPWVQAAALQAPGVPVPSVPDPLDSDLSASELRLDRSAPQPRVSSSFQVRSTLTFTDFLQLKSPQSLLERLLVLAYFLEKYQQRLRYTPAELQAFWRETWPTEALESSLWQEALDAGFLEWETPEALTLTYRGHVHVHDGLA